MPQKDPHEGTVIVNDSKCVCFYVRHTGIMYGVLRCTSTFLSRMLEDYKQMFFFTSDRDLKGCSSERSKTVEVFLFLFGSVCSSLK